MLYDRYARLVFSLWFQILRNEGQSEEMTQDVFLSVWRRAVSYEPAKGKVSTWIGSIAHHRAIDIVRRRNRDAEAMAAIAVESLKTPLSTVGLEQRAEQSWERERLQSALAAVPEEQRQALVMAYFHGLTHVEIAKALDQPLGTVKTRIRLAVQKLRDALKDEFRDGVG